MEKLVSIIIPVYNTEEYVEECIKSLVLQTYSNIEIIICDDFSEDNSFMICKKLSKEDSRIKLLKNCRKKGLSGARNSALDKAKGEYILFVDSDDFVEKDYVDKLVKACCDDQICLSICGHNKFDSNHTLKYDLPLKDGIYKSDVLFQPLFFGTLNTKNKSIGAMMWNGCFKAKIINDNNIRFDESIRYAEDWLFYADYLSSTILWGKIGLINMNLYNYRLNEKSLMHTYRVPSKLGVDKGMYILSSFDQKMKKKQVDKELYEKYLSKRYLESVIKFAIDLYNPNNKMTPMEKRKFLKYRLFEVKENKNINKKICSLGRNEKIKYYIYKSKSIFLISLYAKVYNYMKTKR